MTDNADLRAAAQAATPGPWFNQGQMIHGPDQGGLDIGPLRGEVHIYEPQNAAYIALASPDRILALLDELESKTEALEDAARQFGYWSEGAGGVSTGGLSTLEEIFDLLGWDDPHPVPDLQCDEPGCMRQISQGWPAPGGYRQTCHEHGPRFVSAALEGKPAPSSELEG